MKCMLSVSPVLLLVSLCCAAQLPVDPQILAEVNRIKAVDNHTHVPKVVAAGEKDAEFDALPCDPLEPSDVPAVARAENPKFLEAWQKLYGYKYGDRDPAHVRELLETKRRVLQEQGDKFPTWVLDQLNIETMLANRVAMGRGLSGPRFLWVPFDDALLVPFDFSAMADTRDRKIFYAREASLLKRYMSEAGVEGLPSSLDDYMVKVVTSTLQRQKNAGAVAIKFEVAYLRSLDFEPARSDDARKIYARVVKGGVPSKADYLIAQDYIFHETARLAGKLGLAIHIHTGTGCGGYFDLPGSNPALLTSVLNDPGLRGTNFVLIHGGAGPYTQVAAVMMGRPNVYVDFSEQDALLTSRAMGEVIRSWLEWYPEKVMFGTDLAPGSEEIGWEEIGYSNATTGREGLALALTGMVNDGEISRERALAVARMVLRGNAVKLYGLAPQLKITRRREEFQIKNWPCATDASYFGLLALEVHDLPCR